jgi:multidrug efflux system membrane fusion protein
VEEERYKKLVVGGFVAREQYDQFMTALKTAQATIEADEAAVATAGALVRADEQLVETAKLNLAYTEIKTPIDGRTGSLMLHEGNVVRSGGTSDSTLLVINQIQPIYVSFTVPQQQLGEVKKYMQAGSLSVEALPSGEKKPERGRGHLRGQRHRPHHGHRAAQGELPQRGEATLARPVRQRHPDPHRRSQGHRGAVPGRTGGRAGTVRLRGQVRFDRREPRVVVARTQGSDSVIASGLQAGEQVVTDGQPRLSPGVKVEIRGGTKGSGSPRPFS